MTRMRIALAAVLCLTASTVYAQTHFVVSAPSASVYKAPTNVSPVVGEAKQGTTLEVTRDVGSWVKVAWSNAPDGVGYVRKSTGTMGSLGPAVAVTPAAPATKTASTPAKRSGSTPVAAAASSAPSSASAPRATAAQGVPVVRPQPAAVPTGYVAPTHRFGVGGQVGGSAMGAGFSARGWTSSQKFGVQIDVTHSSMSNEVFFTRMSATQVGPRVLYAFRDHVSDSTWVRPYVGAGAHVLRASLTDPAGVAMSDTRMSAQFFGGAELTLSAVPRLGLSADVGYQWYQSPFVGYTLDGMMVGVSAHWYLK